jgi:hypothetical protein
MRSGKGPSRVGAHPLLPTRCPHRIRNRGIKEGLESSARSPASGTLEIRARPGFRSFHGKDLPMPEPDNEQATIPPMVKDLAEAVSTQAKFANRLWVVLIAMTLLVLLPPPLGGASPATRQLPFALGIVESSAFNVVALAVLGSLIIGFCQAQAQCIRTTILAHRFLDTLAGATTIAGTVHPRDLFDALRTPTLGRAAPLPQLLQGKFQFFPDKPKCPPWRRRCSVIYYVFLKLLAFVVYLVLPAVALYMAHWAIGNDRASTQAIPSWAIVLARLLEAGAAISLLHLVVEDVRYLWRVVRVIWDQ